MYAVILEVLVFLLVPKLVLSMYAVILEVLVFLEVPKLVLSMYAVILLVFVLFVKLVAFVNPVLLLVLFVKPVEFVKDVPRLSACATAVVLVVLLLVSYVLLPCSSSYSTVK